MNSRITRSPALTLRATVMWVVAMLLPLSAFANPQTVGVSFKAISLTSPAESTVAPPDPSGDAGPAQILVAANGRIKVFDKTGVAGPLDATLDTFFNSVRNGVTARKPRVRYDRLSGRWFVTAINTPALGPNRILIAVSSGPVITGVGSFSFHQFQQDTGALPAGDTSGYVAHHSLGVDRHALYIGAEVFTQDQSARIGATGFVVNKSNLLGGTLTVTAFRQMSTQSQPGPLFPQGVHSDDPAASEGYFIGVDSQMFSRLALRRVNDPGGTPSLSANVIVTVPTTTFPELVPHLGMATGTRRLSALDDRLFAAELRVNKLTGTRSLWTAHAIEVNASGTGSSTGNRNGARWYELRNLASAPIVNQSGTLFDSTAISPRFFWVPTVAMSGQGHMALGCSTAGANFGAEIAAAGRLFTDPPGTIQSFTLAQDSTNAYNLQPTDGQSWGEYTQTVVDPNDDMTMWTFQQYCDAENSWGLQVVQLLAPPPAMPISADPAFASVGGSNLNITITGLSSSGSGFFDPGPDTGGPGFASHVSATVNGGGVTVNSVTFNSPTSVTLNINVAAGAAVGSRTVTITNPDGQSATDAEGILTISDLRITSIARNGNDIQIGFNSTAGRTYRVEWKADVAGPTWTTLANNVPGTGGTVFVTDFGAASLPGRFYRVELLP